MLERCLTEADGRTQLAEFFNEFKTLTRQLADQHELVQSRKQQAATLDYN